MNAVMFIGRPNRISGSCSASKTFSTWTSSADRRSVSLSRFSCERIAVGAGQPLHQAERPSAVLVFDFIHELLHDEDAVASRCVGDRLEFSRFVPAWESGSAIDHFDRESIAFAL